MKICTEITFDDGHVDISTQHYCTKCKEQVEDERHPFEVLRYEVVVDKYTDVHTPFDKLSQICEIHEMWCEQCKNEKK